MYAPALFLPHKIFSIFAAISQRYSQILINFPGFKKQESEKMILGWPYVFFIKKPRHIIIHEPFLNIYNVFYCFKTVLKMLNFLKLKLHSGFRNLESFNFPGFCYSRIYISAKLCKFEKFSLAVFTFRFSTQKNRGQIRKSFLGGVNLGPRGHYWF